MKSATQVLCCAVAATLIAGHAWAATSGPILTNPAAWAAIPFAALTNPAAEPTLADEYRSIVPDTLPVSNAKASASDAAAAAGDACCDCGSCLADGCCCGDGCDCGSGLFADACDGPLWMVEHGGVVLSRSQPVPSIIADPIASATGLRATDFSIGTTVGLDLSLARRITERGSLEVRYLGALEWDPRAEFTGLSDIDLGGIDLNGITGIGGGYNSTLDSTEINWRRQQSDRLSLLAGFRWIELQDTVDFFVTTGLGSTSLAWNTNNHLYGGQAGADYLFWEAPRRPISVKGSAKFGVFGNDADNDFSQFVGPIQLVNGGGFGSETSFVTDLGLWAAYQFTDQLSVRGGGMFLYIDGVAIASDQIAASLVQQDPDVFDSSGYVYYMGGLFSVDYVW